MAQDAPRGRELKLPRVTLSVATADKQVELHVAPDYLTTLEFDSPVDRDAVTLSVPKDRFALFEVNSRSIVLKPAMELAPGLRLTGRCWCRVCHARRRRYMPNWTRCAPRARPRTPNWKRSGRAARRAARPA
jgi:hypothetical protein